MDVTEAFIHITDTSAGPPQTLAFTADCTSSPEATVSKGLTVSCCFIDHPKGKLHITASFLPVNVAGRIDQFELGVGLFKKEKEKKELLSN